MNVVDTVFNKDIVLDEEAFSKAINDFEELGNKLQKLQKDIKEMLDSLKAGFDTPAGRKFLSSCETNLNVPLDAQEKVIRHISTTLTESRQAYESVFSEYSALQSVINNLNKQ